MLALCEALQDTVTLLNPFVELDTACTADEVAACLSLVDFEGFWSKKDSYSVESEYICKTLLLCHNFCKPEQHFNKVC